MKDNKLIDFSMQFAIDIVKLHDNIKGYTAIKNQLLKSGTSIGANIHEANYAQSRADFIAAYNEIAYRLVANACICCFGQASRAMKCRCAT